VKKPYNIVVTKECFMRRLNRVEECVATGTAMTSLALLQAMIDPTLVGWRVGILVVVAAVMARTIWIFVYR
jgi:hypothetical protein